MIDVLLALMNGLKMRIKILSLSEREKQILKHVMNGLTDKEIAEIEFIEPSTVKTHINKIFKYYDVHSRVKLIVKLYKKILLRRKKL